MFSATTSYAVTKTSTGSGSWGTAGTWSPSGVPASTDDVVIQTGHTISYNGGNATVLSLTTQGTGTLSFNENTSETLIITGAVTNNGTIQVVNAAGTRTHTLSVRGNFTNNGTVTPTSGDDILTVTFTGTGVTQTISGTITFFNLTLNNATSTTNFGTSSITIANTLTTTAGTMDGGTSTITFTGAAGTMTGGNNKNFFNLVINSGASITNSGSNITIKGDLTNNGTFTPGAVTVTFNGSSSQTIGGSQTTTFTNLTINNGGAGVSLAVNTNVSGVLALTNGDITTGSNTLFQNVGSTSTGNFDVVGNVNRSGTDVALGATRAYGNQFVQVTNNVGTAPTSINVNLVKAFPNDFSNAVTRTYTITQNGGTVTSATVQLHYIDSELNGNTEAALEIWKKNPGGSWVTQAPATARDTTNNFVNRTLVTLTSTGGTGSASWTLSSANAPTDVELISFDAKSFNGKVVLDWQTGYEVDNLGFNIYRELDGKRTRVNSDIIAGSALLAGAGTVIRAGESYSWTDTLQKGEEGALYWLEDIDLKGTSTWRGPFVVRHEANDDGLRSKRERSILLSNIASRDSKSRDASSTRPVERTARLSAATAIKPPPNAADLASAHAIKISVSREGFYRLSQPQLIAAGLNPSLNPRFLQLFVEGRQLPIIVTGEQDDSFGPSDAVEFYGLGLDSPSSDSRVYWLVEGQTFGHRVAKLQTQGGPASSAAFLHTVERKDKSVYFPALRNGEADNFFGSAVTPAGLNQTVALRNLATGDLKDASIEILLQGVTEGAHQVRARLNGNQIGTISFSGQQQGVLQIDLPHSQLTEGDNTISLVAEGGATDTSLVERIRVSYYHAYRADDDSLRLTAQAGQQVSVSGFTGPNVRVLDVTDPDSVTEIEGVVEADKTGFSVRATVGGSGERRLIAIEEGQARQAASVTANQPSKLRAANQGADLIIVAHNDFIPGLAQLKAQRESQNLSVAIVNVEDIYDEFASGHKTPQAIKDFLTYAKASWKKKPQFALLAGDATFDPRNYLGLGSNDFVPTKLVETSFNETASDDWFVDFNGDSLPDIAVGRLPVRTPQETTALVTKIVNYDQSPRSEEVLLVADRNEGFDFETATAELKQLIPTRYRVNEVMRATTDDATARDNVLEAVNRGQKVINYLGHGSTRVWAGSMLHASDAPSLANSDRLSLIVAMTCLNGMFQHPSIESFAEAMLKGGQGGAVAVWASSGMTAPDGQKAADRELIRQLFTSPNTSIGEATVRAKAMTADQDTRRTWILFGDPSAKLR